MSAEMSDQSEASAGGQVRVAHVTEAPLGGVLSYLEELIHEQAQSEAISEIHVLVPAVNVAVLRGNGGPKVSVRSFAHARGSPMALLRLGTEPLRLLREVRPDILHVHSTFAGVVARLAALLVWHRPSIVYCPHGWAFSREGGPQRLIAMVEQWLARYTDKIVCISEFERREAKRAGIPWSKLVVVENGIHELPEPASEPSPRAKKGRLVVLFVGRFDRQKGFDTFLEVMRLLGDEAEGVAVGDYLVGQEDASLELPLNVTVLGWMSRADIMRLHRQADLLIVPSRWEGFGLVAVEAMRSHLAVFASRVGGLQEVVEDRRTGRLFPPQCAPEAAELVSGTEPSTLEQYGEQGYQRFLDRFTSSRMHREVLDLYAAILNRSLPGANLAANQVGHSAKPRC
jgi:glycosyltransferase involved in cell wall biosynthesis